MGKEWTKLSLNKADVTLFDCVHQTPPASETGYPYIAIPQLQDGRINLSGVRRITRKHFVEWTQKVKPSAYDVILSRRCNPGETAFVPPDLKFALGQNLVLLRSNGTKIYPPFLRWLVQGPEWWGQISKYLNVGAVFDSLRCADIPKFKLSIPPLPEQRAIAHILGTIDDKIELNRKLNATLEATARAIFKSWFVDFDPVWAKHKGEQPVGMDAVTADLFPDDFEESELGLIPKGWSVGQLKEIIKIYDSKRVPLSRREREKRPGPYPYYGATSIMDYIDDYIFDGIYVLFAEDGSVIDENGHPVLQYVWGQFWANNHAHVLQGRKSINTEQLLLYLKYLRVEPYITGAVQLKINQRNLKSIPVILASREINLAFQQFIEPLFTLIRETTEQSRALTELRDTLLPKLISGDLRVPEEFLQNLQD